MKDWTGSYHSVFANISTSNHSDTERELNDYYATPPICSRRITEARKL